MTKTQAISKMIIDKMISVSNATGNGFGDKATVRTALDHVLGEGTYDKLVSDLYDELRKVAR